jgi:hypothetical protein
MTATAKSVCVDLDGVLAKYDHWRGVDHIGDPLPGAVEFLRRIKAAGARVVVYTTRTNADPEICERIESAEKLAERVRLWLDAHGFEYDEIYAGQGKALAAAYVDDRAVPCLPQIAGGFAYEIALLHIENLLGNVK